MRLLSLGPLHGERPGVFLESGKVLDLTRLEGGFFSSWRRFFGESHLDALRELLTREQWSESALVDPEEEGWAPPIPDPSKIICLGRNYLAHAEEQAKPLPDRPLLFPKLPNALIGHESPIPLPDPEIEDRVDYEAELAVVIGRRARDVSEAEALDHVAGYTILNDISGRRTQRAEKQWLRAKGFDGFAPCGPWFVTADEIPDPQALEIECRVNGELRQSSDTGKMIFSVAHLIRYLSATMTLEPGDIISTGTPGGVGEHMDPPRFLADGDRVTCSVAGIGVLENRIIAKQGGRE